MHASKSLSMIEWDSESGVHQASSHPNRHGNSPRITSKKVKSVMGVEVKHRSTDCTDYTDSGFLFLKSQNISLCFTFLKRK